MCGLFGVAGDLHGKDLEVFKDLMLASQTRGTDATGLAAFAPKSNRAEIHKSAVPSSTFLDLKRTDSLISTQFDVLMGHTRKATGAWNSKHNPADAHPFWSGDIIGAHNGVIPSAALNKLKHSVKDGIDSEVLIHNIAEDGLEAVIPTVWGAYALSLMDIENKKLGFVRNSQRTLSFWYSKSKKTIYWASEGSMLKWAVERHDIEMLTPEPQLLLEDVFLEFDLGKHPIVDTAKSRQLKGGSEPEKKHQPTTHYYDYRNGNNSRDMTRGTVTRYSGGSSTNANKPVSTVDTITQAISRLERQLLEFNFANACHWTKKERNKFNGTMTGIEKLYEQFASLGNQSALPLDLQKKIDEDEKSPSGIPGATDNAAVIKHLITENGCAYCGVNEVDDKDVDCCTIGRDGDVLCPTCAKDETFRQIAGAPEPKRTFVDNVIVLSPPASNILT